MFQLQAKASREEDDCYLFCQRVETTTQNRTTFTQDEIVEQTCVNYMHCFRCRRIQQK